MEHKKYRKPCQERETIATTIRTDDGDDAWHVYTENQALCRRFTKLWGPGTPNEDGSGTFWIVPRAELVISRPRRYSEEQRTRLKQHLDTIRPTPVRQEPSERQTPPSPSATAPTASECQPEDDSLSDPPWL